MCSNTGARPKTRSQLPGRKDGSFLKKKKKKRKKKGASGPRAQFNTLLLLRTEREEFAKSPQKPRPAAGFASVGRRKLTVVREPP